MKNSRKTEKIILAVAAFAAVAAVVLWWHLDSAAMHRTPVANVPSTTSAAATVVAPARTQSVAQAMVPGRTAPPAAVDSHVSAPAPVPAESPQPTRTNPQASSVPAQTAVASSSVTPESSTEQSSAAVETGPGAVASIEEVGGHDETIELFAERIAKLEQSSSSDPTDMNDARQLSEFDARAPDDEAAPQRMKVLRDRLAAWLADFPPERVNHMKLVSVECRTASCRILVAEEAADVSAQLDASFSASFGSLVHEEWCRDLGLVLQSIAMHAAGGEPEGKPDHALWTIYLGDTVSS